MNYKLIYIEWQDALSNDGWMTESDLDVWTEKDKCTVKQTGWIYKETEKTLTIFSRLEDTTGLEPHYGQIQKIPKTWIRKRKILKI